MTPEVIGLAGGTGNGLTGSYVCPFSSLLPEENMLYCGHRFWKPDRTAVLSVGRCRLISPVDWPELPETFEELRLTGIPAGLNCAHPKVFRRNGRYELFCWLHGRGAIRYVKCTGTDGLNFAVENFGRPCLYHPYDAAVKLGGASLIHVKKEEDALPDDGRNREERLKLVSNDAASVFYDSAAGEYVMYTVQLVDSATCPERRVAHDNVPEYLRMIERRTSADGLEWSDPELVVTPAPDDPLSLQFYSLIVLPVPGGYFGVLGYYDAAAQTVDLQPALSRDGRNWKRYPVWNLREGLMLGRKPVRMLFTGPVFRYGEDIVIASFACNFFHNEVAKLKPEAYVQSNLLVKLNASEVWRLL